MTLARAGPPKEVVCFCVFYGFFFFISFSNLLRSPPTTSSLDDFSCKGFIFQLFSPSRPVGILYKTVFSSFPNPTFIQSRLSTPVNRLPCIFNSRIMHQHSPRTISIVARLLSCTLCSSTTRRSIRWYSRPCTVNTCVYLYYIILNDASRPQSLSRNGNVV